MCCLEILPTQPNGLSPLEDETAVITLGNQRSKDYIPTVGVHGGTHGIPVIIPECASDR